MNLVLGFILSVFGAKQNMVCSVPHSDLVFIRDQANLEKTVTYRNMGAVITEKTALDDFGFVTVSKYGKDITFQMKCKLE